MTRERARPYLLSRRRVAAFVGRRRVLVAIVVGAAAAGLPSPVIASSGGGRRITDADNTRTVYLVATVLIALAIGLAVFTWWFWRSTRRDHEALAPLEVMGDRKFLAADTVARQVMLDGNRPVGAAPLVPGASEPLAVAAVTEPDTGTEVDAAPATLVLAAVGDEVDGAAEATTEAVAPVPAAAAADADATDVSPEVADDLLVTAASTDPASESPAEIGAPAGSEAAAPPAEGDATMALDVTGSDAAVEPVAAEPVASNPAADLEPEPVVNSSSAVPAPIDPGLPVPPVPDEPVPQLSLAELVALHPEAPIGFDDDELASTPSTGIPVIESAEAWVERQLASASPSAIEGAGAGRNGPVAAADDPSEPTPAAARGAE